jgi:hypothetical protein
LRIFRLSSVDVAALLLEASRPSARQCGPAGADDRGGRDICLIGIQHGPYSWAVFIARIPGLNCPCPRSIAARRETKRGRETQNRRLAAASRRFIDRQ